VVTVPRSVGGVVEIGDRLDLGGRTDHRAPGPGAVRSLDQGDHGIGNLGGVAGRLRAATGDRGDVPTEGLTVRRQTGLVGRHGGVDADVGGVRRRVEDHRLHPGRGQLVVPGLGQGGQRGLARGIESAERHRHPRGDRADLDQGSVPLPAQVRDRGPVDPHGAEHVDVELALHLLGGERLDRAHEDPAGVVDHHVEPSGGAHHGLDRPVR
jgi:hypothetical protein